MKTFSHWKRSCAVLASIVFTAGQAFAAVGAYAPGRNWSLDSSTDSVAISGSITATNPSVSLNGAAGPTSSTQVGGLDGSGNLQPIQETSGALDVFITGGVSNASVSSTGAAVPSSATLIGAKDGSGNLQPVNITATGAVKVDGSAVTQPVSGTVTSNIGTTNGLALDTSVNGLLLSQGSSTSGQKGSLHQGAVTTSAPSYTTGQTSPLSLNTSGGLRVDGSGVTQPISAASLPLPSNAAQETGGNLATLAGGVASSKYQENLAQVGGSSISLGQTTMSASVPVAIASNQSAIPSSQSGTWTVQPGNTANTTPWLATINQGGNSASVTGSNALKVDNSAVTQPANITQVGGSSLALGQTTMSSSVPVTLASNQSTLNVNQPDATASASLTAQCTTPSACSAGTTVTASNLNGYASAVLHLTGAWSENIIVEASNDGTNWNQRNVFIAGVSSSGNITANGYYRIVGIGAYNQVRARCTSFTSGSATAQLELSAGDDVVGVVNANASNLLSSAWLSDGSGNAITSTSNALDINVKSGSVTANIGTTNGLALDASVTGLHVSQGSSTSGQKGDLVMGAVTTSAPSYTTAQTSPLSLDTSGNLRTTPKTYPVLQFLDTNNVFNAGNTTINGSGGSIVTVIASTNQASTKMRIADTTGQFIDVYQGGSTLLTVINPGQDSIIDVTVPSGVAIGIRADGASSITSGQLLIELR